MAKVKQCPCCKRGFREPAPKTKSNGGPPFRVLLEQAAERAGITNSEITRRLGVPPSRVPTILRTDNITERVFKEVAAALGMEIQIKLVKARK